MQTARMSIERANPGVSPRFPARRALGAMLLAATLAGCASGPVVRSDYDHQADFSGYRTFGFMQPLGTDRAGYAGLLTQRLKAATTAQMEMRGYTYRPDAPDLLINFSAKQQQKTDVIPAAPAPVGYYGYRAGFYGAWPGYGWGDDVIQYTEGTLNVDLVDARRKQLVWEGVATGELRDPAKAASPEQVDATVAQIFSRYPFRAGSGAVQQAPKTP